MAHERLDAAGTFALPGSIAQPPPTEVRCSGVRLLARDFSVALRAGKTGSLRLVFELGDTCASVRSFNAVNPRSEDGTPDLEFAIADLGIGRPPPDLARSSLVAEGTIGRLPDARPSRPRSGPGDGVLQAHPHHADGGSADRPTSWRGIPASTTTIPRTVATG